MCKKWEATNREFILPGPVTGSPDDKQGGAQVAGEIKSEKTSPWVDVIQGIKMQWRSKCRVGGNFTVTTRRQETWLGGARLATVSITAEVCVEACFTPPTPLPASLTDQLLSECKVLIFV